MSQMDPRIPRPQQQVQNTYYRPGALAPNAPVVRAPRPELQTDTATALGRLAEVLGRVGPDIVKDNRRALDEAEALKIAAMQEKERADYFAAAERRLAASGHIQRGTEYYRDVRIREFAGERIMREDFANQLQQHALRLSSPDNNEDPLEVANQTFNELGITGFYSQRAARRIYTEMADKFASGVQDLKAKRTVERSKEDLQNGYLMDVDSFLDGSLVTSDGDGIDKGSDAAFAELMRRLENRSNDYFNVTGERGADELANALKALVETRLVEAMAPDTNGNIDKAAGRHAIDELQSFINKIEEHKGGKLSLTKSHRLVLDDLEATLNEQERKLNNMSAGDVEESVRTARSEFFKKVASDESFDPTALLDPTNDEYKAFRKELIDAGVDSDVVDDFLITSVPGFVDQLQKNTAVRSNPDSLAEAQAVINLLAGPEAPTPSDAYSALEAIPGISPTDRATLRNQIRQAVDRKTREEEREATAVLAPLQRAQSSLSTIITRLDSVVDYQTEYARIEEEAYNEARSAALKAVERAEAAGLTVFEMQEASTQAVSEVYAKYRNIAMAIDRDGIDEDAISEVNPNLARDLAPTAREERGVAAITQANQAMEPFSEDDPSTRNFLFEPVADLVGAIPDMYRFVDDIRDLLSGGITEDESKEIAEKGSRMRSSAIKQLSEAATSEMLARFAETPEGRSAYINAKRMAGIHPTELEMGQTDELVDLNKAGFEILTNPRQTLMVDPATFYDEVQQLAEANEPDMSQDELLEQVKGTRLAEAYVAYEKIAGSDSIDLVAFIRAQAEIANYAGAPQNEDAFTALIASGEK